MCAGQVDDLLFNLLLSPQLPKSTIQIGKQKKRIIKQQKSQSNAAHYLVRIV